MKSISSPTALAVLSAALSASLFSADASAQYTVKIGGAYFDPHATSSDLTGGVSARPLGGYLELQSGVRLHVQPEATPTFSIERALNANWSLELMLGMPPKHDVTLKVDNPVVSGANVTHPVNPALNGAAGATAVAALNTKLANRNDKTIATVRQWAPTFFVNYRFLEATSAFRPFVGLGINVTRFKARTTPLGDGLYADGAHPEISLSDSIGPALQIGATYKFNERWSLNTAVVTAKVDNKLTIKTASGLRQEASFRFTPTVWTASVGYSF